MTFMYETIGPAAERLMQLEAEAPCGAASGERSTDRINQRNGHRDCDQETSAWTVELVDLFRGSTASPRCRNDFPSFLKPCRMAETALTA